MESSEDSSVMQRFQSSFGIPLIFADSRNDGHIIPQFSQTVSSHGSNKKVGMPPSHPHLHLPPSSPYSMMPSPRSASQQLGLHNLSPRPSHSRSSSQPPFFSLDSFTPLSPPVVNVSMEERSNSCDASGSGLRVNQGLPPRKGHRRSNSDTPLGFSDMIQSTPQLIPIRSQGVPDKPIQLVKRENEGNKKSDGDIDDDLFRTYMNFENMGTMNSAATEDRDVDSVASERKASGGDNSDNEVDSSINRITNSMNGTSLNVPSEKREGVKRRAGGDDIAPISRHYRSISMDSFMGSFDFDAEMVKIQASLGTPISQLSPSSSMDESLTKFGMDLGNGGFNGVELKKIMGNEKLSEIAISDPKRVKRILANRESAARSKERKVRYISELEHKVKTLQAEATALSAQVTVSQRESAGLSTHNNELKFRLQAMEKQAQLREALHETLTAEVQRLKLAAAELRGGEQHQSTRPQFQLQNRRTAQMDLHQLQHNRRMSQKNGES